MSIYSELIPDAIGSTALSRHLRGRRSEKGNHASVGGNVLHQTQQLTPPSLAESSFSLQLIRILKQMPLVSQVHPSWHCDNTALMPYGEASQGRIKCLAGSWWTKSDDDCSNLLAFSNADPGEIPVIID